MVDRILSPILGNVWIKSFLAVSVLGAVPPLWAELVADEMPAESYSTTIKENKVCTTEQQTDCVSTATQNE